MVYFCGGLGGGDIKAEFFVWVEVMVIDFLRHVLVFVLFYEKIIRFRYVGIDYILCV